MAISLEQDIQNFNLWRQGDERDPLGIWYGRLGVVGDATGGGIKVEFLVPEANRAAHVHFCYDATYAQLTGAQNTSNAKVRLLTNWPDASPEDPGLQGYGSFLVIPTLGEPDFTAPLVGFTVPPINANQRFLPLWTTQGSGLGIVEIESGSNVDLATYSFECFGYYFDRAVLDAPGGPRHPGSS